MLNLSPGDMTEYAKTRNWATQANRFSFRSETQTQEDSVVPSHQLAKMAISYAREMEQIV